MPKITKLDPASNVLVFTDLDGTLLDHDTYRFDQALPAIQLLQSHGVPIISTTSKTVEEILPINRALELQSPFIAENGCIIGVPKGYFETVSSSEVYGDFRLRKLAADYSQVVAILRSLRDAHDYKFTGFADMSLDEITKETGLTLEQAKNSKKRMCSEPIRWEDSENRLHEFKKHLENSELQLLQGGRFWHVSGKGSKAVAMQQLIELYKLNGLTNVATIALGDSQNDTDMLQAADTAIVIKRKDGTYLQIKATSTLLYSSKPGPAGWNESIQKVFPISIKEANR